MKACLNCGLEAPDDTLQCAECGLATFVSSSPEAIGGHIISPEEKSFWDHMDFRQFIIVLIRTQVIWLLFDAFVAATRLPSYVEHQEIRPSTLSLGGYLVIARIVIYILTAIACFKYAERAAGWLVKDLISADPGGQNAANQEQKRQIP